MIVLIIEDQPQQREIIKIALQEAGFTVDEAVDGAEGLQKIEVRDYDCFVVDLDLPKINGQELVEKIREMELITPILILTANEGLTSKVTNLNAGADDYLTKPFAIEELTARINALIRRPKPYKPATMDVGDLQINYNSREVLIHRKPVKLTQNEFRVLEFLARNNERVCTRSMLEEHIWGYDNRRESNVIEAVVYKLRRKLGEKHKDLISTVPSIGYKFNLP